MRLLLILFHISCLSLGSIAQDGFTKKYPTDEYSWGKDVIKCPDGGYMILADSGYDAQIYIIKTNELGELEWSKTFGDSIRNEDCQAMYACSDSTFVITGGVDYGSWTYPFVHKISFNGNIVWSRDTLSEGTELGRDIIETNDSGYLLLSGGSDEGVELIKLDSLGSTEWIQNYGSGWGDIGVKIIRSLEGGFLFVGKNFSSTISRGYVVKLDEIYETEWEKNYGENEQVFFRDVFQAEDSTYVICGNQFNGNSFSDISVLTINSSGDSLWGGNYGSGTNTALSPQDVGYSLGKSCDNNIVIYSSFINDYSILKISSMGDSLQNMPLHTRGKAGVLKNIENSIILTGQYSNFPTSQAYYPYLIKTDSLCNFEDLINQVNQYPNSGTTVSIFPNPFQDHIELRIANSEQNQTRFVLYNLLGEIQRQQVSTSDQMLIDTNGLQPGAYFYQAFNRENILISSGKLISQ